MAESWNKEGLLEDNILVFTEAAKVWNKEIFGHISRRKNKLMLQLEGISRKLSFEENKFLEDLHVTLWKELEAIIIQEEVYWKQLSRCKWINYGD